MVIRGWFTVEDGSEVEATLPSKMKVCPGCNGQGQHSNPAIDGNGLTKEDFDQDPDFERDYWEGFYDVPCSTCGGKRVVEVVDRERASREDLAIYDRHFQIMNGMERESWAEREGERRMGA